MAEKTSDLDRLVNSFANDFQAKLQSKAEATRRETSVKRMFKTCAAKEQTIRKTWKNNGEQYDTV